MDREELKKKLVELNVPESYYSLDGEINPDKRILQKGGGKKGYWIVYETDEKGNKHNIKEFYLESDACEYFFQQEKKGKERENRINQLSSFLSSFQEGKTFIASETGEVSIQKNEE